jgi:threonylcarbamoyladenosine tRNA methylthiotransferase MtaB
LPGANIGADIIPGFPSETDEEAENTLEFIKKCDLNYLHVFPYSKRPNTSAIKMPGHLDHMTIKTRAAKLRAYGKSAYAEFYMKHIGQSLGVLWENTTDEQGRPVGLASNYLRVCAPIGTEVTVGVMEPMFIKGLVGPERLLGMRPQIH